MNSSNPLSLQAGLADWQAQTLAPTLRKAPERAARFVTASGTPSNDCICQPTPPDTNNT